MKRQRSNCRRGLRALVSEAHSQQAMTRQSAPVAVVSAEGVAPGGLVVGTIQGRSRSGETS